MNSSTSQPMPSSSLVSSDTGTTATKYTDEELTSMCDQALRKEIFERCLNAYWDNSRFNNSLIDAHERLQALFDVVLGYTHQYGAQEVLERLTEASQDGPDKVDG